MPGSAYQENTVYSRNRLSGRGLDWSNQPSPYREYPSAKHVPLPTEIAWPTASTSQVMSVPSRTTSRLSGLEEPAMILHLAGGLTARSGHSGDAFYFRACPSAGALYPIEVYLASRNLCGLPDGMYHFTVNRFALAELRRTEEVDSGRKEDSAGGPSEDPSVLFLLSAVFFRSAWKYGKRAYRYCLLDAGHLLENLMSALKAGGIRAGLHDSFPDFAAQRAAGIADPRNEGVLAVVEAGGSGLYESIIGSAEAPPDVQSRIPEPTPSAVRIETFSEISGVQEGTSVALSPSAPEERENDPSEKRDWIPFPQPTVQETPPFVDAVRARRSKRNFVVGRLRRDTLGLLLHLVFGDEEHGLFDSPRPETGLIVGKVEGVEPGYYALDASRKGMALLKPGELTGPMAEACLDQMWLANAGVHFVFHADLERLEQLHGARAYRSLLMKAGRMGERVYLAAAALGLGACGIGAYYDDEAGRILGLKAGERLLYLVAAGAVKR